MNNMKDGEIEAIGTLILIGLGAAVASLLHTAITEAPVLTIFFMVLTYITFFKKS